MATATQLPFPRAVFYDPNGNPLAGGLVHTFVPGGTTPKTTWQDQSEVTPNTNPIILDSAGSCLLFGSGSYDLAVTDAFGNAVPAYSGTTYDLSATFTISSLTNIAALRAYAEATPVPSQYVEGYYTAGDDGAGMFTYVSSDVSSTDNGGTIIVDALSRRWYRQNIDGWVTFEAFGAKGDGTTSDTTAMQNTITAVQGTKVGIRMMRKQYVVTTTLNGTAPLTIEGVGNGSGPGVIADAQCSEILCDPAFTTGDVLVMTTDYSCVFRNFTIAGATGLSFTSACPRTTGAGIKIVCADPNTTTALGSVIEGMAFSGIFTPIHLVSVSENTLVRNNYFQAWGATTAALLADAGGTHENDCGRIQNNFFFGDTQDFCVDVHCGYGTITHNKFLNTQQALRVYADGPANIGQVLVADNSFEEQTDIALFVTTTGKLISSVQIQGNQFAAVAADQQKAAIAFLPQSGATGLEFSDVDVSGNNFYSVMNYATNPTFISVIGTNITIANNRGLIAGGSGLGVVVQLGTVQCGVQNNQWRASGASFIAGGGYLIQEPTCVVVDIVTQAITVADLGSWGDGSSVYARDGKATNVAAFNFTVTNAGAGCIAWRMAGGWLTIQPT